jgi:hypothetical protein
MAVGALGLSLLVRDFAMCHIARGVSSVFSSMFLTVQVSFFLIIRLIAFEIRLTAVLHPGFLVSCHSFLILFLYFYSRSRQGRSLFKSVIVMLLVDSLYAEAIEAPHTEYLT